MRHGIALVLFALGLLTSAPAFADVVAAGVTNAVLSRMSKMADQGVTEPFKQALCADPGKDEGKLGLRPDGVILSGGLNFAKLLPATRATGLSVSLGGAFVLSYKKGADHVRIQAYVLPTAGYSLPGVSAANGKSLPVDAGIGLSFNCSANPNPSDYLLSVGAGGPAGLGFSFGMNATHFFSKAFLAKDPSNTPRSYSKIMSTVRSAEASLRSGLAEVYRQTHTVNGELADRLLSKNVPRWHEDDPAAGRPLSHWMAETAKAAQLSAKSPASAENLTRRVEDFLFRLKRASNDPVEQGQFQVDILSLYQDLGNATHALATSTFPLTISRERRALLAQATNVSPRGFWFKRPSSNYRSYCRATDHFIAVKAYAGGRWAKHYFDCLSGALLSQGQFDSGKRWLNANRALVERADGYRAALGDLTHILNNTYAQYLTGQPVRPESLNVGGVYTGNVFTGCFGVGVSAMSLARTGAAIFRQAGTLARNALGTTPTSPSALVSTMGAGAGGMGLPAWSPSVSLTHPYKVGGAIDLPLSSLPQTWRTVFAGQCPEGLVAEAPHASDGTPTH